MSDLLNIIAGLNGSTGSTGSTGTVGTYEGIGYLNVYIQLLASLLAVFRALVTGEEIKVGL